MVKKFQKIIAGGLLFFVAAPLHAGQIRTERIRAPRDFVADEIIVKFRPDVSEAQIASFGETFETSVTRAPKNRETSPHRLRVNRSGEIEKLIENLKNDPRVEYAEPNYYAYTQAVPNDPYFPYQWNLHADNGGINIEPAWNHSTGNGSVVAIIDTGVAYENFSGYALAPDLAGVNFVEGYDTLNNDTHPNDDDGHGTHLAGIIAQRTNNAYGVAGIAYNASIMPVKVMDASGSGTYADVSEGIIWATDHGAKIMNLSVGGSFDSQALHDAVAYAYNHGVTILAASGNTGLNSRLYPAGYDQYVIAVGASRFDGMKSSYSNFGSHIDLVAPGGDLTVDQNGDGYNDGILQQTFSGNPLVFNYWFFQGTSMATAHVTGIAALLMEEGVTHPDQIRSILQSTAIDKGTAGLDITYGWGLVSAAEAIEAAIESAPTPEPEPQNNPPSANAGADQVLTDTDLNGSEAVTLNGSASSDPDGDTLSFEWKEGNTLLGNGPIINTNLSIGIHTITLKISDGFLEATDTLVITVLAGTPPPPPPSQNLILNATVVSADRNQNIQTVFGRRDQIYALVTVTSSNQSVNNASVQIQVFGPNGNLVDSENGSTNTLGKLFRRLSRFDPVGVYTIKATVTKSGYQTTLAQTTFTRN